MKLLSGAGKLANVGIKSLYTVHGGSKYSYQNVYSDFTCLYMSQYWQVVTLWKLENIDQNPHHKSFSSET